MHSPLLKVFINLQGPSPVVSTQWGPPSIHGSHNMPTPYISGLPGLVQTLHPIFTVVLWILQTPSPHTCKSQIPPGTITLSAWSTSGVDFFLLNHLLPQLFSWALEPCSPQQWGPQEYGANEVGGWWGGSFCSPLSASLGLPKTTCRCSLPGQLLGGTWPFSSPNTKQLYHLLILGARIVHFKGSLIMFLVHLFLSINYQAPTKCQVLSKKVKM